MMEENLELNRFIKASLESGEPFAFHPPRRRPLWKWAAPTLLAASFVCVLAFHSLVTRPETIETDIVVDLITLLSSDNELEIADSLANSAADALLAWQDAPCDTLFSVDIIFSNETRRE